MKRVTTIVFMVCAYAVFPVRNLHAQSDRLIGWWKMDETAGATTLADSSGYSRNATLGTGVSIVDGRFGKAARFDGTGNAWARFSQPALSNLTIAAWVYLLTTNNVYPRIMQLTGAAGSYYHMPQMLASERGQFTFGVGGNNWVTSADDPFKVTTGRWVHAAVVYRQEYTNANDRVVWPTFYINGVRCGSPGAKKAIADDTFPASTDFLGNSGQGGSRALDGLLDDVRLYDAPLSDREILALYQNLPLSASAGVDQTVCRDETILQGRLVGTNPYLQDLGAEVAWSVAAAPAGSSPALSTPLVPVSPVTLPEPGVYTFRLTAVTERGTVTDEVTVTRLSEPPLVNAAPSVTPLWSSTNTVLGTEVALDANVSDDALPGPVRLRWTKAGGPGAVFFDNPFTNVTAAAFSTNGTYTLQLTADDGALQAAATVTVTVSLPSGDLSNGLVRCWRFDEDPATRFSYDSAGNNTLTLTNQAILLPAKAGYGLRTTRHNASAYTTSQALTNAETMTFATWFYYDNAYTNNPFMRLLNDGGGFYILINRATPSETFINFSSRAPDKGTEQFDWRLANITSNRWYHLAVLFDRRPAAINSTQVYYLNGVRYLSGALGKVFPGAADFIAPMIIANNSPASGTRNMDGVIDDMRIYDRFLSEEEIRLLAKDPDKNHAPVIEGPATLTAKVARSIALQGVAVDDGKPSGKTLTCRWSVVSGDASSVAFDDASAPDTNAVFSRTGDCVLMLSASDGEQQAATLVQVSVVPTGTVITIQ